MDKEIKSLDINECNDDDKAALLIENFARYSEARKAEYNRLFPWDYRR